MEQTEYKIPPASLQRLISAMQQFEMIASVISEAIGIPGDAQRTLNIERGVFIVGQSVPQPNPNGEALVEVKS